MLGSEGWGLNSPPASPTPPPQAPRNLTMRERRRRLRARLPGFTRSRVHMPAECVTSERVAGSLWALVFPVSVACVLSHSVMSDSGQPYGL